MRPASTTPTPPWCSRRGRSSTAAAWSRWPGSSATRTRACSPGSWAWAPVPATQKVLDRTGVKLDEIDLFEVNEAFAAQALACARELDLPPDRTNPNGSGISLGHPVAATGAILTVKSVYELKRTGGRYALVTMCIGGGQGIVAIFERAGPHRPRPGPVAPGRAWSPRAVSLA
jgi:hypothetical protein